MKKISILLIMLIIISCKEKNSNSISAAADTQNIFFQSANEDIDGDLYPDKYDRDGLEAQVPKPEFKIEKISVGNDFIVSPFRTWTTEMAYRRQFLNYYFDGLKNGNFKTKDLNYWFIYKMNFFDYKTLPYLDSLFSFFPINTTFSFNVNYSLTWNDQDDKILKSLWNEEEAKKMFVTKNGDFKLPHYHFELLDGLTTEKRSFNLLKKSVEEKTYLLIISKENQTFTHYLSVKLKPHDFIKNYYPEVDSNWKIFNSSTENLNKLQKNGSIILVMEKPNEKESSEFKKNWGLKKYSLIRQNGNESSLISDSNNSPTIMVLKMKNEFLSINNINIFKTEQIDQNYQLNYLNFNGTTLDEFIKNGTNLDSNPNLSSKPFLIYYFEQFPENLKVIYKKHYYKEIGLPGLVDEISSTLEIDLYQWQ